jgi:prophage regulatory protein
MSELKAEVITRKTLLRMVPYTIQHILKLEKAGKFPPRHRFGENRVGWYLEEVRSWQAGTWKPKPAVATNGTTKAPPGTEARPA